LLILSQDDCEVAMRFHHCGRLGCLAAALLIASPVLSQPSTRKPEHGKTPELPPAPRSILGEQRYPIDFATALQLAGVQNAEILLARERVTEAVALRQLAAAQFLPSLNAGTSVNTHTGPLQRANGEILKVNRGSMYVGLGASAVGAGTVTIPGVVWSGNLSRTYFDALAARQQVSARQFRSLAVRNDVLGRVANGYLELLRAEGGRVIALKNRGEAAELARLTASFAAEGKGRKSDANRAATVLEERNRELIESENAILNASARLASLLNLDPSVRLHATDGWVVPAPIVPEPIPLAELIAVALGQRPELQEQRAVILAVLEQLRSEKILPFSPNLLVGYSAGTFGGGSNLATQTLGQPRFGSFDDRQDFDVVLWWTLRNLGIGNVAQIRAARSNLRQEELREIEVLDRIRSEVATAHARTHARFAQIETGERAVQVSQKAYEEDFTRVKQPPFGLLIEALDSLRLLHRSRYLYLNAIVDYNEAQMALYVALGQPPAQVLARPIPESLVPANAP
jgi:outer membrane protein TolC